MNETQNQPADPLRASSGKYLTFFLGKEAYAIPVLKVREIIRMIDITPVPKMPEHIKGVVNLRGKVISIIDLRIRFHLSKADTTERTCIVVVEVQTPAKDRILMGLIVDAVEEVLNIGKDDIEPTPDFGTRFSTEYILGMAKSKGTVKTLLDIDQIISAELAEVVGT
ncbi:MAG: chemotaxis protein CheW [Verrucomicrobiae bacterium]|nr:chemotaxis protein CheW [Verrucomicrobiae bacterium]